MPKINHRWALFTSRVRKNLLTHKFLLADAGLAMLISGGGVVAFFMEPHQDIPAGTFFI